MASGRALLGIKPVQKVRVWYWNGEDPEEEMDRRLAAACPHFGIRPEEINGHLFTDSGREMPIKIAEQTRTGTLIVCTSAPVTSGALVQTQNLRETQAF